MKRISFSVGPRSPRGDAPGVLASEPFDETRLANEIAQALERRSERPPVTPMQDRWLGDEADAALVEAAAEFASNDRAGELTTGPREPTDTELPCVEPSTLAWVTKAQRQRRHERVRGVAGWALSLIVLLIVIAASGLAVLTWSGTVGPQRQPTAATGSTGAGAARQAEADPQQSAPAMLRLQTLR